jgi:hypothetical protein
VAESVPEKEAKGIERRLESLEKKANVEDQKQLTDFLLKDFELKVRYLSDQFTRMWNRFNYFVAIQSVFIALIGGKFTAGGETLLWPLVLTGGILSLIWYVFGAQDRWLVTLYRTQAEEAAKKVAARAQMPEYREPTVSDYQFHTGSSRVRNTTDQIFNDRYRGPSEWVWSPISITRLAAWVPAFTFLIWSFLLMVLVTEWPAWLAEPLIISESPTPS